MACCLVSLFWIKSITVWRGVTSYIYDGQVSGNMRKIANNIRIRAFVKQDEEETPIQDALANLLPFDLTEEKLQVHRSTAMGFNERKIRILELALEKNRHINQFLEHLKEELGNRQMSTLRDQINSRTDEHGDFFVRLDKNSLISKMFRLTDSGDCFHIRINVASYPKNKDTAIKVVESFLH